jgi:FkbM family methyltransferase
MDSREKDREYLKDTGLKLSDKVLNKRRFKPQILELHQKEFMLGQALNYQSKDKQTIDVGASVGLYAYAFAQHSQHVHCFEAVPFVHDNRLNLVAEQFDNITTYPFAVCDKAGTATFYVDDKKLGNNSFSNIVGGQPIEVETVTLDSFDFTNVGFLKIDTEGHELSVLKGATKLIETQRPTCMIEIYPVFNDGPVDDTFKYMWDTDAYRCFYNKRAEGLVEVNSMQQAIDVANGDITVHDGDFLFVAKD